MSIEVKPGRWRMRGGQIAIVEDRDGHRLHAWRGRDNSGVRCSWGDRGEWFHLSTRSAFDLVEYLGPEQPQAAS
jgi:hypothetical protein